MFSACASIGDGASTRRKMDPSPVNGYARTRADRVGAAGRRVSPEARRGTTHQKQAGKRNVGPLPPRAKWALILRAFDPYCAPRIGH